MQLPNFKYHPDTLATGSIRPSDATCRCCGQCRSYIYTGPVYATEEIDEQVCPWCIADGTAHRLFGASFIDPRAVGGYGEWEPVRMSIAGEVAYRTPCFAGWQAERWWTHCDDAAAFLNIAGYRELQEIGQEAINLVRSIFQQETDLHGEELEKWLESFDREYGPSAYLFRCLQCGQLGAYWDCH